MDEQHTTPCIPATCPWKGVLIEANVVSWSYKTEHENDPALALKDLLAIEQQYALDPLISEEAQFLVNQGKLAGLMAFAEWCDNNKDHAAANLAQLFILDMLREPKPQPPGDFDV